MRLVLHFPKAADGSVARRMLLNGGMKAIFKVTAPGGFVSSTLAPANRSAEPRFGLADGVVVVGLLVGMLVMVRLILAS